MAKLRQLLSDAKTRLYRQPKDEIRRLIRWGPNAYFHIERWQWEMEEAVASLPEVKNGKAESGKKEATLEVWFLTGKRFWFQTAFCAWSLAKQSGRELVVNLVDDGSLEPEHEEALRRLFPKGLTLRRESVRQRVETLIPAARFPVLRQRWIDYVHIRKLTDIHLGSTGVKLVLDSDMLFFRRPDAMLHWWDSARKSEVSGQRSGTGTPTSDLRPPTSSFSPCLMTDCEESYGYSRELMEELAGVPVQPLLNVGICGLRSEDLDWEELESWCRTLIEREGTSYYLEQALVAMIASRQAPVVMPAFDYITFPTNAEIAKPTATLQHYVADSKPGYFGRAWRTARGS